jgi:hypothetical protein
LAEAVPKRILELMNVPGLTRENVASHLQVCIFLRHLSTLVVLYPIAVSCFYLTTQIKFEITEIQAIPQKA